ncbi:GNAT domain-containing protein [Paraphoma chrysanthemicola]|uniref:GNAT domain-containing protein n=1 Tax=Paraphoma chrysanthemicola TaxID=798071 RepID=A0A8K0VUG1_9PLEO|nr:GNAT domain-containing protein [Paraphoma chrysanthemicola]
MKLNEHQAIVTPRVLLVPYSAHHVPTYHEWMKDEEIQKATASEPLTLPEEHAMQQSWRLDHDKLTFIVCHAPSTAQETSTVGEIRAGIHDAPERMIGDVNLFLYEDEDEDDATQDSITPNKPIIGELEIMIAAVPARGRGLAHATLLAFLGYISTNMSLILAEYIAGSDEKSERYLKYLRVKIDQENVKSLGLFGKLGFQNVGGVNYFREIEMRMQITDGGGFTGLDISTMQEACKVVAYTL